MKYLMKFFENQIFDFQKNKKAIFNFIEIVKNGEKINQFNNPFYVIITGDRSFSDLFDDKTKKMWNEYFKSKAFITDGVWSQRNFNQQFKYKINNKTYNYYITISKDKNNILLFLSKLYLLDNELHKLSNKYKKAISYKTHTILDMMVNHNDSLKIYFYDNSIANEIEDVVKNWVIENNIKLSNRTHSFGYDIEKDGDKISYGQILANTVANEFKKVILKYGSKYSNEDYFNWISNNLIYILSKIKLN